MWMNVIYLHDTTEKKLKHVYSISKERKKIDLQFSF